MKRNNHNSDGYLDPLVSGSPELISFETGSLRPQRVLVPAGALKDTLN